MRRFSTTKLLPAAIVLTLGILTAASVAAQEAGIAGLSPYDQQQQQPQQQQQQQDDSACGSQGCCNCKCGPRMSFYGEAVSLQRNNTLRNPLLIGSDTVSTRLDSKNMNFSMAPGMRVGGIYYTKCGWDVELAYSQIDSFQSDTFIPGTTYMITDNSGASIQTIDAAARYSSALYNAELNLRHECNDWFVIFGGFRFVELDERYSARGVGFSGTVFTNSNAFNHLYGMQLGAELEFYNRGGPLTIKAYCKSGLYDNIAFSGNNRVGDTGTYESLGDRRDQASFLGETGLVANYAITKRLAFRATAEAMWITGVALAPMQIQGANYDTGISSANTRSTIFYYGGSAGLEYRF